MWRVSLMRVALDSTRRDALTRTCMCQMCRRCGGTAGVSEIKDAVPTDRLTYVYHFTAVLVPHLMRTDVMLQCSWTEDLVWSDGSRVRRKLSQLQDHAPPPPNSFSWDVFRIGFCVEYLITISRFYPYCFLIFLKIFFISSTAWNAENFVCFS